jgi:putative N6-adenine-specific DNA methylase
VQLKDAARARQHAPAVAVLAGDVSFRMTDFAEHNARRAGVEHAIQFKTADALQRLPPADRGTLMLNPPYGERIAPKGSRGEQRGPRQVREDFAAPAEGGPPNEFFSQLAAHWKRHYAGWTAWLLSPDMKLPQALRLKEARRMPLWNGPIECRLFRFDLVAGSARAQPPADSAPD